LAANSKIKEYLEDYALTEDEKISSLLFVINDEKNNPYNICKYTLSNDVQIYFARLLKEFLKDQEILSEETEFADYFGTSSGPTIKKYIDSNYVSNLSLILNQTKQEPSVPGCKDLSEIDDIRGYAIMMEKKEGSPRRIIIFKKKEETKILRKGSFFSIENGKLEGFAKDAISFDRNIDCILIQGLNMMAIFVPLKFEQLFNFEQFYIENSNKALKSLATIKYIAIDKEFIKSFTDDTEKNKRLRKNLSFLRRSEIFDELIRKIELDYFRLQKSVLGEEINYQINQDKLVINDNRSLDDFVNAALENYLTNLSKRYASDRPRYYKTEMKKKIK
jgi:hypothetical protein